MDAGGNNSKRPGTPSGSGKDRKRAKMHQARSIPTQGSASPSPAPPMASSAPVNVKSARMVEVTNFAQARAFEINAMHTAIKRSKDSASQRAFQSLPRNLRRRAASHNIRRLPVRLRERAMREVESDPVKKGKKPANRHKKRRPGTISQEYLRRQGTKRWLETHIWHAKRMKMIEIWGYKLAEHSNENGIRSAYKSSHHQCILQDMSYNGCLELTGTKKDISVTLEHMMDPTMPTVGSARYVTGKRQYFTYLYEFDSYPEKLITPVTFLWRQDPSVSAADTTGVMEVDELSKSGQLWIWIHPSAFEVAKVKIQESVVKAHMEERVGVKDLENSLVMFDFTGPRSTAILQAVLQLSESEAAATFEQAHKAWRTLSNLRTSSSLPPGIVLGLLLDDPRLTFPHKPAQRPASIPASQAKDVQDLITHWPTSIAQSTLWDEQVREHVLTNMTSEAKLNERRSRNLVPGTKLNPNDTDSRIPILLVQREGKPQIQRAPGGGSSEYECGWTLILPKGWAMPFWKSMIFAGARPGGVRERRSFHFETRQSCFPYDFPNTEANLAWMDFYEKNVRAKYERKPVAKRINYTKLGVEDPFGPAWIKPLKAGVKMLGGDLEIELDEKRIWLLQTPKLVTALTEAARAAGGSSTEMVTRLTIESLNLVIVDCLQGFLKPAMSMAPLVAQPSPRIDEALVRVGVDLLSRGSIGMNGMIYAIPEKQFKEWATLVQLKGKRNLEGRPRKEKKAKSWVDSDSDDVDDDDGDEIDFEELEMAKPPPETLIGYVTTGQYCYSEGKYYGIGCCSATGLARVIEFETRQRLEWQAQAKAQAQGGPSANTVIASTASTAVAATPKLPKMMVLVRSIRSRVSRLAKLTILS